MPEMVTSTPPSSGIGLMSAPNTDGGAYGAPVSAYLAYHGNPTSVSIDPASSSESVTRYEPSACTMPPVKAPSSLMGAVPELEHGSLKRRYATRPAVKSRCTPEGGEVSRERYPCGMSKSVDLISSASSSRFHTATSSMKPSKALKPAPTPGHFCPTANEQHPSAARSYSSPSAVEFHASGTNESLTGWSESGRSVNSRSERRRLSSMHSFA
mmetsp:Transcript_23844/g.77559  ORF Transcript_23844/g.77559 Transcript_23844/m.77559 type:complete len:212 (-) Transcript_23844:54-689(-)